MIFSFINISDIIKRQQAIIGGNSTLFCIIPLIVGFVFSILFYSDSERILDVLTLFLSIFIPIFINLLATLISFVMNKIVTRHNKERVPLIKETFYNICYLIPISLALLMLSLLMNLSCGKDSWLHLNLYLTDISFTWHRLLLTIVGTLFYAGIIHIILNLLMVTKRIFKLFDKEIDLLTSINAEQQQLEPSTTKKNQDLNALDGEE